MSFYLAKGVHKPGDGSKEAKEGRYGADKRQGGESPFHLALDDRRFPAEDFLQDRFGFVLVGKKTTDHALYLAARFNA
jgi:hypothetical protein